MTFQGQRRTRRLVTVAMILFAAGLAGADSTGETLPFLANIPAPPGLLNLTAWWLVGAAMVALAYVLAGRFTRRWPGAAAAMGLLRYTVFCAVVVLLLLESYFHLWHEQTDIACITLSSRKWFHHHWQPVNADGFRDGSHDAAHLPAKPLVVVLGDSFAAGHGIENIEDRFSGVLQQKLGDLGHVLTLAQPGWDTRNEWQALESLKVAPAAVVLSLYQNDLENIAANQGKDFESEAEEQVNFLTAWLLNHSYLLSQIYWTVYMRHQLQQGEGTYLSYLEGVQSDEQIWQEFERTLEPFTSYAAMRKVPLLVVVFPMLQAPTASDVFVQRVSAYFSSQGVGVINAGDLLEDLAPAERIINPMDPHASAAAHARVGNALADVLRVKLTKEESPEAAASTAAPGETR